MDNYDNYSDMPRMMRNYLKHNGWHFSKKMCDWAVGMMRKQNKSTGKLEQIQAYTKEQVDDMLKRHNITLEKCKGYDYVYIANMAIADFLGSSIPDEAHLAKYVKDVCDDADGYSGMPFVRFYADCCHSDTPIDWDDML